MAAEPVIDLTTPPTGAVAGAMDDDAQAHGQPSRRWWSTADLRRRLIADRRLVPLAAAASAVAVLGSLITEWQVTAVGPALSGNGRVGGPLLRTDVADLGALGAAYLVGLFPLVTAVVLTLLGPPAGRRYLRLAGLSTGGTMIGLLTALVASLGAASRAIPRVYVLQLDPDQLIVSYGRGLWYAFVGVTLAIIALYLVESRQSGVPRDPAGDADDDDAATAIWTWQRPPGATDDRGPDEPMDLTVGPATPFTARVEEREPG